MILKIKAFRLKGPDIDKALNEIRHITWREYNEQDVVIILLESDEQFLIDGCNKYTVTVDQVGSANMAVANGKVVYGISTEKNL